jgi:hypothetical protein
VGKTSRDNDKLMVLIQQPFFWAQSPEKKHEISPLFTEKGKKLK